MTQNPETIAAALKSLRKFIESTNDPIAKRVAFEVETAIRWATEETVGWPKPLKSAIQTAKMIRDELEAPR